MFFFLGVIKVEPHAMDGWMDGGGSQLTRSDSQLLKSQCSLGNWRGALLISPSEQTLLHASKQGRDHSAGATRWPSGNVDA